MINTHRPNKYEHSPVCLVLSAVSRMPGLISCVLYAWSYQLCPVCLVLSAVLTHRVVKLVYF